MTNDQALAVLQTMKHWRIQCENRAGVRYAHSCTIWNGGKRVTAVRRGQPLNAIIAAIQKITDATTPKEDGPRLRVVSR